MNARTRKIALLFAAVVLLSAAVVGIRARRARREAEAERLQLAGEQAALTQRMAEAGQRLAAARHKSTTPAKPATPVAAAETSSLSSGSPVPATAPKRARRLPTSSELVHADPKLEALELNSTRAVTMRSLAPFFQVRAMSDAVAESLVDAFATARAKQFDLEAVAAEQDEQGKAAVARLKTEVQEDLTAAQKKILGPEGYAALVEFLQAGGVRYHVTALAGAAALESIPITAEQGEALTRVLRSAGHEENETGKRRQTVIDWTAVDEAARRILTPEQFALFQTTGAGYYNSRWGPKLDEAILQAKRRDEAANAGKAEPPRG